MEKFLGDKSIKYRYRSDMVERLFKGCTEKDIRKSKSKKSFAFLSQDSIKNFTNKTIDNLDVQEAIGVAIKESVMSYTRDKNTAVNIYKDFVSYIKEKY
ncbi:MAG TPA: hypothetical protein DCE11_06195 [Ruminiclostridium sp.]|nr:hypothetical protein [Clostridiaceae bacterium]HAA25694.1 hypothetical protein [Ruminiclostridium sp.]